MPFTAYSPALLSDHYQFTMAQGDWLLNRTEDMAIFYLSLRRNPFQNPFTVACGLALAIDLLRNWRFNQQDIDYLGQLKNSQGHAVFQSGFLQFLAQIRFTGDVDAVPEGTLVFPSEPILRIKAPLLQCQLLETALMNLIGYSCLVATKAARCYLAAGAENIIEFGLRRAQGPDGGIMASRAAYIGGASATSNLLAGQQYQIPTTGTIAHSWIMSFHDESTAFANTLKCFPQNPVLVVDTYDTLQGISHAIQTALSFQQQGIILQAIRLDSGDLAALSKQARSLLNAANLQHVKIIASGDLDEHVIAQLRQQQAPIDVWGVGTRLVTCYDQPALDIAYKLSALQRPGQDWKYCAKISDNPAKISLPGQLQTRRYFHNECPVYDVIYNEHAGLAGLCPSEEHKEVSDHSQDLLIPIFRNGVQVYESPATTMIRQQALQQLAMTKRCNLSTYPLYMDAHLQELNKQLQHENMRRKQ